jgi:hypothetical protein
MYFHRKDAKDAKKYQVEVGRVSPASLAADCRFNMTIFFWRSFAPFAPLR